MVIQPTLLSALLPVKTAQTNLSQWSLGQVLNATVISQKSANTVILEINNQRLETKTNFDKPTQVGEQLKLVVEKQGTPMVLRVLQNNSSVLLHENRQQLLRLAMPKQAGMEKISSLLNHVTNNARQAINILPAPIEHQMKKLIQHLPTKENIKNALGLKTVIKDSGLLLESKLMAEVSTKPKLNNQTPTTTASQAHPHVILKDLKKNLLQVSGAISKYKQDSQKTENTTIKQAQTIDLTAVVKNPQLTAKTQIDNVARINEFATKLDIETIAKQIESSIARIEVNQTKIVVTNDNQFPTWSIETPVKDNPDIDLLKLDIHADKESNNNNKKEQMWTVNLKIDFEKLGSLSARLSMFDNEVSATLWSEASTLNKLINENLALLDKQIERCGLTVGSLTCLEGAPTEQDGLSTDKLINIKV
jgi:Flagellar hook-length control protein FliK